MDSKAEEVVAELQAGSVLGSEGRVKVSEFCCDVCVRLKVRAGREERPKRGVEARCRASRDHGK